ncbi:MAG TPA: 50S ribosomal protein L9 [Candidatus Omnitrophota bacterium]|nr:50S ribosomal protein L9 [Candidatus Omnitrophota bacterium]HPS37121.1 50S ribosomal protein L9 [Candidatus Omnitrophota bacterium]
MELLLLKDVADLGKKGDVVRVRDGFARNLLIPNGQATPATRENQKFFEDHRARSAARKAKEKEAAEKRSKELRDLKITMEVRAGEGDKLFGSVTPEDIRAALAQKGHEFDKKQIRIKEALKTLGVHQVDLELYPQVKTRLTVELVRQP